MSSTYTPKSPPEMIASPDRVSSPPYCSTPVSNPDTDVPSSVISSVVPRMFTPVDENPEPCPELTVIFPYIAGWILQWYS